MPMKLWRYQSGGESSDAGDNEDAGISTTRGPLNVMEKPSTYSTPNKKKPPKSVRLNYACETFHIFWPLTYRGY